jgi:hypothetical protein
MMDRAMNTFELLCPGYGPLTLLGRPYTGHDHFLGSNAQGEDLDLICFFDSRGISGHFEGSLVEHLIEHAERVGLRYLMICRPLELTTWATLVNFLTLNDVTSRVLLTNMGFVDFTPKKSEILLDAMRQIEAYIGADAATSTFVEESTRLTGETIQLYAMTYGAAYGRHIERTLSDRRAVVINSPVIDPRCVFPRPRPASFFAALKASNTFNQSLAGVEVIDLPEFNTSLSYDGVHYTAEGSRLIYDRVKEFL